MMLRKIDSIRQLHRLELNTHEMVITNNLEEAVLDDLLTLYTKEIFDRTIEFTTYPIPVGVRQEPIVFWEIR